MKVDLFVIREWNFIIAGFRHELVNNLVSMPIGTSAVVDEYWLSMIGRNYSIPNWLAIDHNYTQDNTNRMTHWQQITPRA